MFQGRVQEKIFYKFLGHFEQLPFNNRLLWPKYQEQPISHKDKYLWQSRFLQPDVFLLGALGWEAVHWRKRGGARGVVQAAVYQRETCCENASTHLSRRREEGGGGKKKRKIDGEVKRD